MNHRFKKKYGQNFLKDEQVLNEIIDSVEISNDDLVIEVGPGSGALTKKIIEKTNNIICYEIDTELKKYLDEFSKTATIIYDDFLNRNLLEDIKNVKYEKIYVIANIPYYITTPIIEKILDSGIVVTECVLMVQKEVADRFSATPCNKEYGSITVFLNYYFEIEKLFNVNKDKFYPVPNVDSAIIKLKSRKNKILVQNEEHFFKLIKDSFRFKRKTVKNNLTGYDLDIINQVLNENELNLNSRSEEISVDVFAILSNRLLKDKENL